LAFCERWLSKGATEAAVEIDGVRLRIIQPEKPFQIVEDFQDEIAPRSFDEDLDPEQAELARKERIKRQEAIIYRSS